MGIFNKEKSKQIIRVSTDRRIGELQYEFKRVFGVTLRIYHKLKLVPSDILLGTITNSNDEIYVDNENTIKDIVELFNNHYGLKIQIADADDKLLIDNERKIGNYYK